MPSEAVLMLILAVSSSVQKAARATIGLFAVAPLTLTSSFVEPAVGATQVPSLRW